MGFSYWLSMSGTLSGRQYMLAMYFYPLKMAKTFGKVMCIWEVISVWDVATWWGINLLLIYSPWNENMSNVSSWLIQNTVENGL